MGIILEGLEGVLLEHSLHFDFQTTNNQVEYKDLIIGLNLVKDMGVKLLIEKSNSQLIVGQVNRTYKMKVPCLNKYLDKVKAFLETFNHFELQRIP